MASRPHISKRPALHADRFIIRAPVAMVNAVTQAAGRRYMTVAEYVRQAVLKELKADKTVSR